MTRKDFANAILGYRLGNNLDQSDFGHLVGASQQSVAQWELGSIPKKETLKLVCELIDVNYEEIAKLKRKKKKYINENKGNNDSSVTISFPTESHRYAYSLLMKADEETVTKIIGIMLNP